MTEFPFTQDQWLKAITAILEHKLKVELAGITDRDQKAEYQAGVRDVLTILFGPQLGGIPEVMLTPKSTINKYEIPRYDMYALSKLREKGIL